MRKLKLPSKISFPRKRMYDIAINHLGEIFLAFFVIIFCVGFYIFWKYAWTVSNFQPLANITSQTIPTKSLEGSLNYIVQKEASFTAPLEPLHIRDPFMLVATPASSSSSSSGTPLPQ